MKSKYLHIVAFDNPYPPNYGGVIDIFFKIKALHSLGIKIILHVFLYDGKEPESELQELCHKVYYYNRRRFTNPFSGELPYIVSTRNDEALLKNLCKDKYPILFEGLHTTYFLSHQSLEGRNKIVRTHNVEHHYYKALEDAESGFFKKYFFRVESERLKQYESVLKHATVIAAISPAEARYYKKKFEHTQYIPAFHNNEKVTGRPGKGKFILYHGNLGVGENNKAALYLMHEVFSKIDLPVVIAGNNPSRQLKQAIKDNLNVSLADKISSNDILELVSEAHINVIVTFQATGIKLKLLNSLYRGRFCVVNEPMITGTGLKDLCISGDNSDSLISGIENCWDKEYGHGEIKIRERILGESFDNLKSAELLATLF